MTSSTRNISPDALESKSPFFDRSPSVDWTPRSGKIRLVTPLATSPQSTGGGLRRDRVSSPVRRWGSVDPYGSPVNRECPVDSASVNWVGNFFFLGLIFKNAKGMNSVLEAKILFPEKVTVWEYADKPSSPYGVQIKSELTVVKKMLDVLTFLVPEVATHIENAVESS